MCCWPCGKCFLYIDFLQGVLVPSVHRNISNGDAHHSHKSWAAASGSGPQGPCTHLHSWGHLASAPGTAPPHLQVRPRALPLVSSQPLPLLPSQPRACFVQPTLGSKSPRVGAPPSTLDAELHFPRKSQALTARPSPRSWRGGLAPRTFTHPVGVSRRATRGSRVRPR